MHSPRSHKLRLPGHGHGDKPQPHANVHGDGPRASKTAGMVLLLLLALAQLMVILDISAVNVALPDLAKDLNIAGGDLGWTITSYSLVFGSLLLLGGRAADLLGRRRVFLTGLGVFTVASLASALATSAGGASSPPAPARASAQRCCRRPRCRSSRPPSRAPTARRRSASGVPSAAPAPPSASCSAATLTELVDWRAIFLINLPVGVGVAVAAMKVVPADVARPQWRGLDLRGARGRHRQPRRARLRPLAGRRCRLDLDADARPRPAGLAGLAAFAALELHTRTAAAATSAARRARRRRRLRDDAGGVRGPVRLVPADVDLSAGGARHRRAGDRARVPADGRHHRPGRAPRQPSRRPRRVCGSHGSRVRADRRRHAAAGRRRQPRQLRRRCPAGHARRRPGPRHRARLGGALRAHRRRRRRGGHAVGLEHDRPRDRRLARRRRPRHHRHRRHRHGSARPPAWPTVSATRSWSPASSPASPASSPCSCFPRRPASCPSCALAPRVAIH